MTSCWRAPRDSPLWYARKVKEDRARGGSGWPATHTVNKRAQSGLGLIHILAALGYDWGLQVLLPLGAKLNLQVSFPSRQLCQLCWGSHPCESLLWHNAQQCIPALGTPPAEPGAGCLRRCWGCEQD